MGEITAAGWGLEMLMYSIDSKLAAPPAETDGSDLIHPDHAISLYGLMYERALRSPNSCAYRQYDEETLKWQDTHWHEIHELVARWHNGLASEGLRAGDRVAICMRNCIEWVAYEMAAQSLGLVTISLYPNDRADNMAFILEDSGARIFLVEHLQKCNHIKNSNKKLPQLKTVLCHSTSQTYPEDELLKNVVNWLPAQGVVNDTPCNPDSLATIVYTSGTTGRPKGVMLSHRNLLWDAWAGLQHIMVYPNDTALSFLPLSHTLERTIGFILPMMSGASVAFSRSIPQLAEDLQMIKPTIIISVPRIFERILMKIHDGLKQKPAPLRWLFNAAVSTGWQRYKYIQGRQQGIWWMLTWPFLEKLFSPRVQQIFGGRLRFDISGGAPLYNLIARTFISLGINIQQGYGLTETSPVISVNTLNNNRPETVGTPFSEAEVRIGEDNELQVRSPGVMMGYWNNHTATFQTIDTDGWLHTGDKARIDPDGHISITGRLKEIIVLATGEKIPPADVESAISTDPLFSQVMVIGEGHSFLSVLVVLNQEQLKSLLDEQENLSSQNINSTAFKEHLLQRIFPLLHDFPGYAQIFGLAVIEEDWTVENDLLTPTLKLKRHLILLRYKEQINDIYSEHDVTI
ncbi:MAG: long-chain fatty acid--CoA ligase [Gammaproteobacteria bacterium]|nr:long-chain fatty acid--CoA ligase [Gammaproteobacteria bacterium]MDX2488554.1 long-chain fatty acid--CoA ligase [Gammaproteobacteria bacterium]